MFRGIFMLAAVFVLGCGPRAGAGESDASGGSASGTSDTATATGTGPTTSVTTSSSTTGPECRTDADCGDFDTCENGMCVECIGCCSVDDHPTLPRCSPPIDTETTTWGSTSSSTTSGTSGSDTSTGTSGGATPQGLCEQTGGIWDRFSCGHYECGVPSPDACVDPGCDCGEDSNFVEGVGCQVDPACN